MLSRRDLLAMTAVSCATYGWESTAAAKPLSMRPSKGSYRVEIGHGRRLGVVKYGDPLGYPVLYFHGLPTCRFEAAILSDYASAFHCRLIAVDRPGIGLSSPQPGRTILGWTDDVSRLVDSVIGEQDSQRSYAVLGFSSGGPFAVASAHRLRGTGLKRVAIVSGVKSPQFSHLPDGNGGRMLELVKRHPRLARTALTLFAKRCHRNPAAAIKRLTSGMACADQRLLHSSLYRGAFLRTVHEAMRQGPCGILGDALLLTSCWHIPLSEIKLPVSIWHGACDKTIAVAASHKLAEHIPGSHLTIAANEGHVSMLRALGPEILTWLSTGRPESHSL